jgi:hypothetical protein
MKPEQVGLSIGIGILLASIFFVGVQMALGFTPWLLNVIPLGLTYWIFHLYAPAVMINHQLAVFHYRSSSIEVSSPLW